MKKFVIRLPSLLAFMLAIALGAALFWVSQQVQQLERTKENLMTEIANEQEGMRVLNAEWDYLNRPDRLEVLVERHLQTLERVEPENLLRDASAVPEPNFSEDESAAPIMVSVAKSKNKTQASTIANAKDKMPSQPIEDKESNGADEFEAVLDNAQAEDQ